MVRLKQMFTSFDKHGKNQEEEALQNSAEKDLTTSSKRRCNEADDNDEEEMDEVERVRRAESKQRRINNKKRWQEFLMAKQEKKRVEAALKALQHGVSAGTEANMKTEESENQKTGTANEAASSSTNSHSSPDTQPGAPVVTININNKGGGRKSVRKSKRLESKEKQAQPDVSVSNPPNPQVSNSEVPVHTRKRTKPSARSAPLNKRNNNDNRSNKKARRSRQTMPNVWQQLRPIVILRQQGGEDRKLLQQIVLSQSKLLRLEQICADFSILRDVLIGCLVRIKIRETPMVVSILEVIQPEFVAEIQIQFGPRLVSPRLGFFEFTDVYEHAPSSWELKTWLDHQPFKPSYRRIFTKINQIKNCLGFVEHNYAEFTIEQQTAAVPAPTNIARHLTGEMDITQQQTGNVGRSNFANSNGTMQLESVDNGNNCDTDGLAVNTNVVTVKQEEDEELVERKEDVSIPPRLKFAKSIL